jgi:hypothetical protein
MAFTTRSGPRNCNTVWRNGTAVTSYSTVFSAVSASTTTFAIGLVTVSGVGNLYLNGQVAEAGFFNRELSVAEVSALSRMLGARWGITVA